jgi:hypothetical protein
VIECRRCLTDQPESEFYVVRKTGRRRDWCRTCVKEYVRQWQKDRPETFRRTQRRSVLKREYGLAESDYIGMVEAQGNSCALCRDAPAPGQVLHVDHCHVEGHVRGLLCNKCNRGLGYFRDNPALLRQAAEYLRASMPR